MTNYNTFDYVPSGVLVMDIQKRVLFWNQYLENITQIKRKQIIGHPMTEFFSFSHIPLFDVRLNQVCYDGIPFVLSARLHRYLLPVKVFGREQIQHTTVAPVDIGDSQLFGALFIIQDVTDLSAAVEKSEMMQAELRTSLQEQIQIQTDLTRSQRRSQLILESTPDIITLIDTQTFNVVYCNHETFFDLGYSAKEMNICQSTLLERVHPDDREKLARYIERALSLENSDFLEIAYRVQTHDGIYHWILNRDRIITDENGEQLLSIQSSFKHYK